MQLFLEKAGGIGTRRLLAPLPRFGMRLFRRRSEDSARATAGSSLEKLYKTAQTTFRQGRRASNEENNAVRDLLDGVPLRELGVEELAALALQDNGEKKRLFGRFSLGSNSRVPTITYLHICENQDFCIGIFCLPKGCDLPFHDHPQMTVFSRVLYGTVHVKAYDWVGSRTFLDYGETQPARLAVERIVRGGDPSVVLFPSRGGNIHRFRAETACAVMDLIAPPYDMDVPEKSCSYYQEVSKCSPDGIALLKKTPDPRSFRVVNSNYKGVQVE